MRKSSSPTAPGSLKPFAAESGDLHVIIETPKGSRNKFNYDEDLGLFKLGGMLPAGAVFPFDFGFVPATLGGDGDPLDVLLLMDEPAFAGCLVEARLIGVIEAEQTEDEVTTRNDRLIAVASASRTHKHVRSLSSLNEVVVDEIEHFFVSYNEIKQKVFKPLGRFGPQRALKLVAEGEKLFRQRRRKRATKSSKRQGASSKRR
ncbi:MAG: inorganic pyrophosphatase [Blastocatellia bacterium]|nr:inorganic pyrophosphatase [Blastocatellia bacterium]